MEILAPKFVIRLSLKFLGINIHTTIYGCHYRGEAESHTPDHQGQERFFFGTLIPRPQGGDFPTRENSSNWQNRP